MFKISKEKIEDYRDNNNLPALADSWLQDVIDFDKIEELQELINDAQISNWPDLIDTLAMLENQEEIEERLNINY